MMNGVLDGRSEYIDMITPPMALCCGFLQYPFATEKPIICIASYGLVLGCTSRSEFQLHAHSCELAVTLRLPPL